MYLWAFELQTQCSDLSKLVFTDTIIEDLLVLSPLHTIALQLLLAKMRLFPWRPFLCKTRTGASTPSKPVYQTTPYMQLPKVFMHQMLIAIVWLSSSADPKEQCRDSHMNWFIFSHWAFFWAICWFVGQCRFVCLLLTRIATSYSKEKSVQ